MSGRIVGPYVRYGVYISGELHTTFSWGGIFFVMPAAPKIFKLSPNSKRDKIFIDHGAFFHVFRVSIAPVYYFKY